MQQVSDEERHLSSELWTATLVLKYKGFQRTSNLYNGTKQEGHVRTAVPAASDAGFDTALTFNFWMPRPGRGLRAQEWRVTFHISAFLKKDFTYLSLERGEGRKKEEETNIDV